MLYLCMLLSIIIGISIQATPVYSCSSYVELKDEERCYNLSVQFLIIANWFKFPSFLYLLYFIFFKANGSIKAGDVLIVEKPYASVLLPDYRHSHCYHCMKLLVAPIP